MKPCRAVTVRSQSSTSSPVSSAVRPAAAAHDVVVMVYQGAVDVLVAHSQNVHVAGFGELLEILHNGK